MLIIYMYEITKINYGVIIYLQHGDTNLYIIMIATTVDDDPPELKSTPSDDL